MAMVPSWEIHRTQPYKRPTLLSCREMTRARGVVNTVHLAASLRVLGHVMRTRMQFEGKNSLQSPYGYSPIVRTTNKQTFGCPRVLCHG